MENTSNRRLVLSVHVILAICVLAFDTRLFVASQEVPEPEPGEGQDINLDGNIELKLRKEVVAALKDTASQKQVVQFLQQEFGVSDMEWAELELRHDVDGDGVLSEEEFLQLSKELIGWDKNKGESKKPTGEKVNPADQGNKSRDEYNTIGIYCVLGLVGLYVLYVVWKAREESKEKLRVPEQDTLRAARLSKLAGGTAEGPTVSGESSSRLRQRVVTPAVQPHADKADVHPTHDHVKNSPSGTDSANTKDTNEDNISELASKQEASSTHLSSENLPYAEGNQAKNTGHSDAEQEIETDSSSPLKDPKSDAAEKPKKLGENSSKNADLPAKRAEPKASVKSTQNTSGAKKVMLPKAGSPEKDMTAPQRPLEEQLRDALSAAFGMSVVITAGHAQWTPGSLQLKPSELPSSSDQVLTKCHVLFQRVLARQYVKKISFVMVCYESCLQQEDQAQHTVLKGVLKCMKDESVRTVVDLLKQEAEETESMEDDFWSQVATGESRGDKTAAGEFLLLVAGLVANDQVMKISDSFLHAVLTHAHQTAGGCVAVGNILQVAAAELKACKRKDEMRLECAAFIAGLERLLSHASMVPVMHKVMEHELTQVKTALGSYYEHECALGPLLSLTTLPRSLVEGIQLHSPAVKPWLNLPGFPQIRHHDLRTLEDSILCVLLKLRNKVFLLLKSLVKAHPQTTLAWLASVISANEMREGTGPKVHPEDALQDPACSDGFMLNFCPVLLELCLPFCQGNMDRVRKISAQYPASPACRLNYHFETCLAGGQLVCEEEARRNGGFIPEEFHGHFNFMTEIFHLTLRAFHIGFLPALSHFNKIQRIMMQNTEVAQSQNPAAEEDLRRKHVLLSLQWDCCLMETMLLRWGTQFYLTVAQWLQMTLEECSQGSAAEKEREQRRIMSQVPEFIVKDMAQWFWFMASQGIAVHKDVAQGLELSPFVDCCVTLLRRPDIMPGPIPAFRIAQALQAFMRTTKNQDQGMRGWGSGLVSEWAAIVQTCPAAVEHLGPALLHTYVSVDVVEGLDVDKEDFDKYAARAEIGSLLENLWSRDDCRSSVLKLCGSSKFQSFLGAILDTLLYQLHDSLARLANVRKVQTAKDDESTWQSLSMQEKMEKDKFLKSEQMVAKGFMKMSNRTLRLLDLVSQSAEVARCLTVMPMSQRAASAFLGFIEALCGAKATELKVKDMEKYSFNPRQLLSQIVDILLRIVRQDADASLGFVSCLASDPDYSGSTLTKAASVLETKGLLQDDLLQEFSTMLEEVSLLHEALQQEETSAPAVGRQHSWQTQVEAEALDDKELEECYTTAMKPYMYQTTELEEYHSFQSNAGQSFDPRSQRAKALMREMKQWSESLPVHPNAAVYVCQDEERMDLVRALVTGPVDTPYSRGCFLFDIYFPSNYPNIPPLVKLITTGNGTVRFNPNLYADGKVCLSLLGTWHSGDASQKWQANKSTLYQVLVSIQSMILISDPMYNEPGYEGIRGTAEGQAQSDQYNSKIRLWTVRHAMLGQLQAAPPGFRTVIRQHFRLQRTAILRQCSEWLRQCKDEEERKLRGVVDELRTALATLNEEKDEDKTEDSGD